jgi:hypothetical protein
MSDQTVLDAGRANGLSELEFIIAGHSHMFALGASFGYSGPVALTPIEAGPGHGYFLTEQWSAGRGASYWDALFKHSVGRAAVLMLHGNQHFTNFLFAREPLFDFVDPMDPGHALYPGAVLVPRRMVKASPLLMPAGPGGLRSLILQLRARGCLCVVVTGTPPVREDFVDYVDQLRAEAGWREIATSRGIDIATCRYTPAAIMKRLWGVMQEFQADVARETGARFVPVPTEAVDPRGYLAQQYRGPLCNFTHANDQYGLLMLEHIVNAVRDAAAQSAIPQLPPVVGRAPPL